MRRAPGCLRDTGRLCLAEVVPRRAQRLGPGRSGALGAELVARLQDAEDAAYRAVDDPLVNWDAADLEAILRAAGFELRTPLCAETQDEERRITDDTLARWFGCQPVSTNRRPSYAQHLLKNLTLGRWRAWRRAPATVARPDRAVAHGVGVRDGHARAMNLT